MITDTQDWIASILTRTRGVRLTLDELCDRSDITRGTFSRWKTGVHEPTIKLIRQVEAVLDKAEAELP